VTTRIVISPLSNDPLRDWPLGSYIEVADLCVQNLKADIEFVGTREQRTIINQHLRRRSSERYINRSGRLSWSETTSLIGAASCVIGNNSGIVHLAASQGIPTVCLFCASHSPLEWMARGPHVRVLTSLPACAPCAIGHISDCRYGRRCFVNISSDTVFRQVATLCVPVVAAEEPGRDGWDDPKSLTNAHPMSAEPQKSMRLNRWMRWLNRHYTVGRGKNLCS
jgi:ADP-heptose:LPS heptosyltransferase